MNILSVEQIESWHALLEEYRDDPSSVTGFFSDMISSSLLSSASVLSGGVLPG